MPTLSGPSNFVGLANAVGGIVLTWSGVTGNTGYTLLRSTASGDYSAPVTATVTTNIVTYTVSTGLTLGTPYYFVAQTSNASGLGAYSAQTTATPRTPPSAIASAPVLTAGNVNISVGFVAPDSNGAAITSYSIQRATVLAMTTGLTTTVSLTNPYPSTGLVNGTQYFYRVAASNAAGLQSVWSPISSNTPAAVPAIVVFSASSAGVNTVSLAWTAPANNGAAITSYNLNYSTDTSSTGFTSLSSGLLVSPFVATGLTNGSLYYFQMAASNVMGYGPYSLTASNTPRTVPSQITDLSAIPSTASTTLSLNWSAPFNGGNAITGYRWYRSTSSDMSGTLTNGTSTSTTAAITGLVAGTMYYFQVVASNVAGTSISSSPIAANYPRAVPGQVGTVTATTLSGSVSLSWLGTTVSNGSAISSYLSQYSLSSAAAGSWVDISSSADTSIVAIGLTNGTPYYFRVAASNIAGYGSYSTTVSKIPYTVPSQITDLAVTPSSISSSLILNWSAPNNNGTPISGYRWFRSSNSDMSGVVTSNATLVTTLSTSVTSLTAGAMYYFQIVATNSAGTSLSSAPIVGNYPRAVPNAVGTVTATSLSGSVSLSWLGTTASNGSAISSYLSQYSLSSAAAGEWTEISNAAENTALATGLTNGTTYYFRVAASNVAGYGSYSTTVSKIPYTVPDKVGTINVTPLNASVSLSWPTTTASNGNAISSYYYYWSLSGSGTWTGVSNASNVYTKVHTIPALSNGSSYSFYVAASNAAGFGLSSDVVTTIPRTVPGAPTSVAAAVRTFDSVTFTFIPPASNGGNAITSYIVTPLLDGTTAQTTVSGSSSPIIVSNAIPGRGYTYRVVASNDAGASATATSASVITYYNLPVGNPNGNTYTYYASNQPWSSKVIYNLNYADVEVKQTAKSVWTISYAGLVDTLNYVRNIALTDRNVWIMDISYGANLGNNYETIKGNLSNGDVLKVGSGEYFPSTQPTVSKSITLEGPPDRSAFFGVAPGVSTWCLTIEADNVTARNLTLTTGYAMTNASKGDFLLMAYGAYAGGYYKSIQNTTIENMTFVNPYTLNRTASELQYWRNRRGIALNSMSGLTIRNCEFPMTWNNCLTLASCRNVNITGNTFYAAPWSSISVVKTNQAMSNLSDYESSNINIADDNIFSNFVNPLIDASATYIANPSIGVGSNIATYITPLQKPILTFQATASYAITYSSNAGSSVQIPDDFRYSFVSSPLLAYVARDPLDLPQSFWNGGATSVVVTDLSTNTRVYPPGYCSYANRNIYKPTLSINATLTNADVTVTVDPLIPYATYTFSIDASEVQTSNVSGSYTFTGAGLTEGQHTVSVTGTDGYDAISDITNINFTFDSTPPAINFLSSTTPDISGNVIVNFDISDPAGLAIYTTYLNDVSYADNPSFPETVHLPAYGTHTIKVSATDNVGNTITSSPISISYAPTPGQAQDLPIESGQTEIPLSVGGNVVSAPVVATTDVESTVLSGAVSDGSYIVINNAGTGTAALFTKDNTVGNSANSAAEEGVSTVVIQRGDNDEIVTVAKVGRSGPPVVDTKTINGSTVSGTVNTSTAGSNTVVFGIQNSTPTPPQLDIYFKFVAPDGTLIPDGFEIYVEFDAPQFARMDKVGINRSEDNQKSYTYAGDAKKVTGTAYTFGFTFTQNSDYRLAKAYGSGIGDPYIMTIQGNLYKIPPFNGPMRLYQGAVGNQLLTVNATTRIDDDKTAMDGDTNAVIQTLTKPTGPHDFNMTEAMSFFEKIYISYGGKSMVVDVYHNEFRVEGATPETWEVKNAGRVEKVGNTFDFYSNLSARNYDICPCPGVTVRIGIIPIRSVRSSVDIIAPNMEDGNGAFVHRLSRKAMTLRKLASEAPVERRDCPVKRTLGEVFVCNEFTKEKQIPFVG